MSLLWLDRFKPAFLQPLLTLHIGQERIVWTTQSAGWKRKVTGTGVLPITVTGRDINDVLAGLPQWLSQMDIAGAGVAVIVSSHFTRYAIVPNPDGAASKDELSLLCRHAFERVHGETVAAWDIQLSLSALGGNGLASAVDRDFLELLDGVLQQAGCALLSVQPSLAYAFNQLDKPGVEGMMVLVEPGRLSFLAWQKSSWQAVQLLPALPDWQAGLDAHLARFRLALDVAEDATVTVCHMHGDDMTLNIREWSSNTASSSVMVGASA